MKVIDFSNIYPSNSWFIIHSERVLMCNLIASYMLFSRTNGKQYFMNEIHKRKTELKGQNVEIIIIDEVEKK
jgi:hypothetical protein